MENIYSGEAKVETLPEQKPIDWTSFIPKTIGGILAYNIANNFINDDNEKKKDQSLLTKILLGAIPFGAAYLGWKGGDYLGQKLGLTKTSDSKGFSKKGQDMRQYITLPVGDDGARIPIAKYDPSIKNKVYELIATEANKNGRSFDEAATDLARWHDSLGTLELWGGEAGALGSGWHGLSSWRNFAKANKIPSDPFPPVTGKFKALKHIKNLFTGKINDSAINDLKIDLNDIEKKLNDMVRTGKWNKASRMGFVRNIIEGKLDKRVMALNLKKELMRKARKRGALSAILGTASIFSTLKGMSDKGRSRAFDAARKQILNVK